MNREYQKFIQQKVRTKYLCKYKKILDVTVPLGHFSKMAECD